MDVGYVNRNYEPYFTKENIQKAVHEGSYAMIESSVNSEKRTETEENAMFALLGQLLTQNTLPHRQAIGSWERVESYYSFFVIKPEDMDLQRFRQIIFDLGEQFRQASVVLATNNDIEIVYTTGEHVGTACVGHGYKNIDENSANYTKIRTSDEKDSFIGEFNIVDHETCVPWRI